MSVFDRIDDPFKQWGEVPTDSQFCQNCEDKGIDRWVHFGYGMPHADIVPAERYAHHHSHQLLRAMRRKLPHSHHLENKDDDSALPSVNEPYSVF